MKTRAVLVVVAARRRRLCVLLRELLKAFDLKRCLAALVALLLTALVSVLNTSPAAASTITARTLLFKLAVSSESGGSNYDRSYFTHWIDTNGDCQNTRAEVLVSETETTPTYSSSSHCTVAAGKWYSTYDGATWTNASDVDIDHLVPLKEAWESGARLWSTDNRTRYANDLSFWPSLIAVTDNVNQSKGDRDPTDWLPPRTAARCTYAIQWVQVKYRWSLSRIPPNVPRCRPSSPVPAGHAPSSCHRAASSVAPGLRRNPASPCGPGAVRPLWRGEFARRAGQSSP